MGRRVDELLGLLKAKTDVLKLLGQMWELLYIESKSPDVGIRRENLVRLLLRKEIGLEVEPAPPMERSWDFKVIIGEREKFYSLKTAEGPSAIKVAWNGFPSMQRARRHQFVHPILYIKNDRKRNEISVAVFDVSDLETVQREMGNAMWWMPRGGTNPRGFGISSRAARKLVELAMKSGNYVKTKYEPLNVEPITSEYWDIWYEMLKKLSSRKFV